MIRYKKPVPRPTLTELEAELKRVRHRRRYADTLRSTVFTIAAVAAAAVLVATLWMPVLRIYGTSMEPTLEGGNIVLSVKSGDLDHGDIVAFYYNNKVLVKRVIALPGETVEVDDDGAVYVDGVRLKEDYIDSPALGECDQTFPYRVPDSRIFVMGDNREGSLDSRTKAIGCVADEQVVGKLIFRIWPLGRMGIFK